MRIIVTGSEGQLGRSLQQVLRGNELLRVDLPDYDITEPSSIDRLAAWKPDFVIHAAAMTDVDGCELNPDAAYQVNSVGTRNVVLAARKTGADLLYVSTDYVFDGRSNGPYCEFDRPNPLNVYGRSKLAGERFVRHLYDRYYIARTAWVYGPGGNNFVEKILELVAERPSLSMVTNEYGSPTYTVHLAEAIAKLICTGLYGTYHLTNRGLCSRYEFTLHVLGLAGHRDYPVEPSQSYPRPATIPARVEMRNFCAAAIGITLPPWDEGLEAYFKERHR